MPRMKAGISTRVRVTSGSRKCSREPASQSMCSTEWCTAWIGHRNLTSCIVRWIAYSTRSASTIAMTNCTAHGNDETDACMIVVDRPGEEGRREHRRGEGIDADQQVVEQEIAEIVPPIRPQDRLLAQMRPQLFEKDENHRRQHQVEDEPVEPDIAGRRVARPDLHRGAAAPQRQQGQA